MFILDGGPVFRYDDDLGLTEVMAFFFTFTSSLFLWELPGREHIQANCPTCGPMCSCLDLPWFNDRKSITEPFWR